MWKKCPLWPLLGQFLVLGLRHDSYQRVCWWGRVALWDVRKGRPPLNWGDALVWLLSFHRFWVHSLSVQGVCTTYVPVPEQWLFQKINDSYITFPQKNAPSNISHGIFRALRHFLSWSIWKTLSAGSEEIIFLLLTHTYPVSQTILPTPTIPDFLIRNFSYGHVEPVPISP